MRKEGEEGGEKATLNTNKIISVLLGGWAVLTDSLEPNSYWGIVKIYTTDAQWVQIGTAMPHHLQTRQDGDAMTGTSGQSWKEAAWVQREQHDYGNYWAMYTHEKMQSSGILTRGEKHFCAKTRILACIYIWTCTDEELHKHCMATFTCPSWYKKL